MRKLIALTLLVGLITLSTVLAQKTDPPAYKLSVTASAEFMKLEQTKLDAIKAFQEAAEKQHLLLVGANIPDGLAAKKETDGTISFAAPSKPSPTPTK